MSLLDSQTHESKRLAVAVLKALWPELAHQGSAGEIARRLADVIEVLGGRAAPCLSADDRTAIEAKARELEGEGWRP